MTKDSSGTHNIIALIAGIWFLCLGWIWVYWVNVILAFPVAIVGFIFWRRAKDSKNKRLHDVAGIILLLGLISSVVALLLIR